VSVAAIQFEEALEWLDVCALDDITPDTDTECFTHLLSKADRYYSVAREQFGGNRWRADHRTGDGGPS